MQTAKAALVILMCAIAMSACGLKGPLFLPDQGPGTTPIIEQGSQSDTENREGDKEDKNKNSASS